MVLWRGLVCLIRYATVHVNTGALSELFTCGRGSRPVVTPLANGDLLLAKDNIGIFIGPDGKASRKVRGAAPPCLVSNPGGPRRGQLCGQVEKL